MGYAVRFFQTTPRLVMGPGSLNNVPEEIKRLGGGKVLIVTDAGLVGSGLVARLEEMLDKARISHERFDEVPAEAAQVAKKIKARVLISIDGGSPIDIAKVASILAVNSELVSAFFSDPRTAFANGADLKAREAMMRGSLLAGVAFANAGVTAVHAFAYPISAEFHIPHGVIMLTPVMETQDPEASPLASKA